MSNEVVKYHNELNTIPFRKFTARDLDLFFALCSKMKGKEDDIITFSFSDLKDLINYKFTGKQRFVEDLDVLIYEKILEIKFKYDTVRGRGGGYLFTDYDIDEINDTLTISVNKKLTYILNEVEGTFTRFELQEFTNLRSTYAKNMYRLLKQWRKQGCKEWSIEEFRSLLDVPEKYTMRSLTQRVLAPIEAELAPIFVGLKVSRITSGRGGKVTALKFTFQKEVTPTKGYNPNIKQARKVKAHEQEALDQNESPESRIETVPPVDMSAALAERIRLLKSSGKQFD